VYSADATTIGVFWGLDPAGFSSVGTLNGKSIVTWNFKGPGPVNFSVSQSGWKNYSSSATLNSANSLVFVPPANVGISTSPVTNPTNGPKAQFNLPTYINFQNFTNVIGVTSFMTLSKSGNIQFNYPGTYAFMITPSGLGAPTRIGVGHTSTDARPVVGYTYDFVYTYNVQFSGQNPRAVLTVIVSDTTQFYFIDFETATGTSLGSDAEVVVTDINEFWSITGNSSINYNTLNFSSLTRYGINQQITPNTSSGSNTFSFGTAGLYNIYGSLSVNSSNTISSVALVEQQLIGFNRVGKANVISQWNSPQSSSPSVNFSLPVQVLNPSTNNYSIIVSTNDTNPLGNAISPTSFGIEYFGSSAASHQNDFGQNGLLLRSNVANYPLATSNINLFSVSNVYGSSYHVSVTPGGNLTFSNVSQYRLTSYFETSNSYVSNVTVWSASSDALLAPGGSAALVASRTLPLGITGGYTLDFVIPITLTSNNYQIRVGMAAQVAGQTTTNVTANTYFTVVGMTQTGKTISYSYVDSVGTYLVESAELRIGGQSIQTLTGEMIEIYNDLFVPQENQPGISLLTGKLDSSTVYNPRTYYINLPFFFYGSAELSLPICALDLQDLEIWVTFNNFQNLLTTPGQVPTPYTVTTSVIVDYAYLSDPEIMWFQRHRQNYIIRQIQYDTFGLGSSLTFPVDFIGPVRELYFVIQDSSDGPYVYETDTGLGVTLRFNGEDYIDSSTMNYNFMRFIGPLEKYARQPDRILHVVPLCRNPLNTRPTGSVNMSRINQKNITFTFPTLASLSTKTLRLMAVSYNILRVEDGLAGIIYQ